MSFEIPVSFVEQYSSNVYLLLEQKAKLRQFVTVDPSVVGKTKFTEQVGNVEARDVTERHGDSPLNSTPHARRAYHVSDKETGDLIDTLDRAKMLIDPQDAYVRKHGMAMARSIDRTIITAATGNALTGEDGTTSVALPSDQKVAVDFVESGAAANSGLTVGKLREASKIFGENNVDEDEEKILVVAQQQITDLLRDDEVTSADYNTVRALVNGMVNQFMGFTFVRTQLLNLGAIGTDIRKCFAFVRSGIELGIGKDITARISERGDKRYSWYVYYCLSAGATRLEEEKVVEIACDESP